MIYNFINQNIKINIWFFIFVFIILKYNILTYNLDINNVKIFNIPKTS